MRGHPRGLVAVGLEGEVGAQAYEEDQGSHLHAQTSQHDIDARLL